MQVCVCVHGGFKVKILTRTQPEGEERKELYKKQKNGQ